MKENDWFIGWFDSKYYHILYKNRDHSEAKAFIRKLTKNINLAENSSVLDLGCGKGRHSIELSKIYKNVIGIDLSSQSSNEAKKTTLHGLSFSVQDMREFKLNHKVDGIFNLFTSFGYFGSIDDNLKVLKQCNTNLNEKGLLIIDFFNANKVKDELIKSEVKTIDEISFHIKRKIVDQRVVKTIQFKDNNQPYSYIESVQLLTLKDFTYLFSKSNFKLINTFGDYNLDTYNPNDSNRLILIAKKT